MAKWFCDIRYKSAYLFLVYEDGSQAPSLWKTCLLFFFKDRMRQQSLQSICDIWGASPGSPLDIMGDFFFFNACI